MSLRPPRPGEPGFQDWLDMADAVDHAGILGAGVIADAPAPLVVPLTPLVRAYLEVSDAHTEWLTKDVPGKRFIELHRAFKARLAAMDACGVALPDGGQTV
jgi:hypothetical protein